MPLDLHADNNEVVKASLSQCRITSHYVNSSILRAFRTEVVGFQDVYDSVSKTWYIAVLDSPKFACRSLIVPWSLGGVLASGTFSVYLISPDFKYLSQSSYIPYSSILMEYQRLQVAYLFKTSPKRPNRYLAMENYVHEPYPTPRLEVDMP